MRSEIDADPDFMHPLGVSSGRNSSNHRVLELLMSIDDGNAGLEDVKLEFNFSDPDESPLHAIKRKHHTQYDLELQPS